MVETNDLQDLKWTSKDTAILVWDNALENQILIYSAATADLLTKYQPETIGLGIKTVSLSPDKNLMAAGMFDGSIYLYNNLVAQEIASLQHLPKIDLNLPSSKTLFVY